MSAHVHEAAAVRLLIEIETLRRLLRLYPPEHPALPAARLRVARAAEELSLPAVSLAFGPDKIFFDQNEVVLPKGSPVVRLRQLLCRLGLAAIHLTFPEAAAGLAPFVERLATLHEPPGEDDRQALLADADAFAGIELIPLDLTRVQLLEGAADESANAAALPVWAELARRLGLDGAFILADKILSGELTAEALAELVAVSADPATLFDQLFGRLRVGVDSLDMQRRPVVLEQIRMFLAEWLALLSPERRHLAVAAAFSHFPPSLDSEREEKPILAVEMLLEAVEFFLDEGLPVPGAVARAIERLASMAPDEGGLLTPEILARCRAATVRIALLPDVAEGVPLAPADGTVPADQGPDLPGEVRESMSEEALRRHLVRLLGEVITLWPSDPVADKASTRLAEELISCLESADMDAAARVTTLLAGSRHAAAKHLACNAGVEAAVRAFNAVDKSQHPRITAILQGLGEEALPAILEALANEENLSIRKRLLEVVLQHGDKAIPYLRPLLDDPRWFVVRNAVFALRRLGDRDIGPALKERLPTAKPQVLSEILKALISIEDHQWLSILLSELGSEDEDRRLAALSVASRVPHPAVVQGIIEALRRQTGKKLREPYTVELIRALGRLGNPAALDVLSRIVGLRQWLSPFPLTALRREAALAIAAIDSPEARALARTLATDRDAAVAAAVRRALAAAAPAKGSE